MNVDAYLANIGSGTDISELSSRDGQMTTVAIRRVRDDGTVIEVATHTDMSQEE